MARTTIGRTPAGPTAAAIVGALVYLGVLLIGLDYPLVLALLAAVPAVGAALTVSPAKALLVIGFYSVMHDDGRNGLVTRVGAGPHGVFVLLVNQGIGPSPDAGGSGVLGAGRRRTRIC